MYPLAQQIRELNCKMRESPVRLQRWFYITKHPAFNRATIPQRYHPSTCCTSQCRSVSFSPPCGRTADTACLWRRDKRTPAGYRDTQSEMCVRGPSLSETFHLLISIGVRKPTSNWLHVLGFKNLW